MCIKCWDCSICIWFWWNQSRNGSLAGDQNKNLNARPVQLARWSLNWTRWGTKYVKQYCRSCLLNGRGGCGSRRGRGGGARRGGPLGGGTGVAWNALGRWGGEMDARHAPGARCSGPRLWLPVRADEARVTGGEVNLGGGRDGRSRKTRPRTSSEQVQSFGWLIS